MYRTWGKWRFLVQQKMSFLSPKSPFTEQLGPQETPTGLSGSEGAKGRKTREGVWKNV